MKRTEGASQQQGRQVDMTFVDDEVACAVCRAKESTEIQKYEHLQGMTATVGQVEGTATRHGNIFNIAVRRVNYLV